jgi:hypothetical protein
MEQLKSAIGPLLLLLLLLLLLSHHPTCLDPHSISVTRGLGFAKPHPLQPKQSAVVEDGVEDEAGQVKRKLASDGFFFSLTHRKPY